MITLISDHAGVIVAIGNRIPLKEKFVGKRLRLTSTGDNDGRSSSVSHFSESAIKFNRI